MQYWRFWYRGGLSLVLAMGIISCLEPQMSILAVPQSQAYGNPPVPSMASVFTDKQSVSQSVASKQASQQVTDQQMSKEVIKQPNSRLISNSHESTMLENMEKGQHSKTAVTRATRAIQIVNGTVRMTLDADGTLHLSGGSFRNPVSDYNYYSNYYTFSDSDKVKSWIAKGLTANGTSPDQVSKIVIEGRITSGYVTDYGFLFAGLVNLTNIAGLANLDLYYVTNLRYLFRGDRQLQQVDFGLPNLSRVKSFEGMFAQCSALTNIVGISQWNTTSVTNLSYMFFGASSLTTLPIGKWHTSNVMTLAYMLANCSALTSLDVADWDTRNVTSMNATFQGMTKIASLPIYKWQTGKVVKMQLIFNNDTNLETLDVGKWDTRSVRYLDNAFNGLNLTTLPIGDWNTSSLETMQGLFAKSAKLTTLPIGRWDVSQVTNMNAAFMKCASLTTLPLASWNTKSVTNMGATFSQMDSVTTLPIGNWDTHSVTNMSQLFSDDSKLQVLNLGKWNTANVTNLEAVFSNTHLEKLDLTGWNTNAAKNYANAFSTTLPPKRLLLGKDFNFKKNNDWKLSNPSKIPPYTGKWQSVNDHKVYTAKDLTDSYDGKTIIGEFDWELAKTITVRYVDADGKSLAPDTQIQGSIGDNYQVKPIKITGYEPELPNGINGSFTDKNETITLKYSPAQLRFISVPQTIGFGNNPITGKLESYDAKYDTGLVIQDNRPIGSTWSLSATLAATGFRGETSGQSLVAAMLSYKDQRTGAETALQPGASGAIVNSYQTSSSQTVNVLGATPDLGTLYLKVPTDRVLMDTYQTTLTWSLNQIVANN